MIAEFILARNLVIYSGRHSLRREQIHAYAIGCKSHPPDNDCAHRVSELCRESRRFVSAKQPKYIVNFCNLPHLVSELSRGTRCADLRDRVIAMLGLHTCNRSQDPNGAPLVLDYGSSMAKILVATLQHIHLYHGLKDAARIWHIFANMTDDGLTAHAFSIGHDLCWLREAHLRSQETQDLSAIEPRIASKSSYTCKLHPTATICNDSSKRWQAEWLIDLSAVLFTRGAFVGVMRDVHHTGLEFLLLFADGTRSLPSLDVRGDLLSKLQSRRQQAGCCNHNYSANLPRPVCVAADLMRPTAQEYQQQYGLRDGDVLCFAESMADERQSDTKGIILRVITAPKTAASMACSDDNVAAVSEIVTYSVVGRVNIGRDVRNLINMRGLKHVEARMDAYTTLMLS